MERKYLQEGLPSFYLFFANKGHIVLFNDRNFLAHIMDVDEPLYTILLNTDEVNYLCEALERGFRLSHEDQDVSVCLMHAEHEGEMQVMLNGTGYDLVSHLQFGGVNRGKMWARVEA